MTQVPEETKQKELLRGNFHRNSEKNIKRIIIIIYLPKPMAEILRPDFPKFLQEKNYFRNQSECLH